MCTIDPLRCQHYDYLGKHKIKKDDCEGKCGMEECKLLEQRKQTEWLDVIIDGRMVEINGKGKIREKHTYFVNGGKDNAQLPSVSDGEGHPESKTT